MNIRARIGSCVAACVFVFGTCRAQETAAAAPGSYVEFSRHFVRNQPDSLMDLALRLRGSSNDDDQRLAALARVAALFRYDDLPACAVGLDSLRPVITRAHGAMYLVAQRIRSMLYTAVGDAGRGLREADLGLAAAPSEGMADEVIALMVVRAEALTSLDELDAAMQQLGAAESKAERERVPRGECLVSIALGNITYKQGRNAEARAHYMHAYAIACDNGYAKAAENALANIAGTTLMIGDLDRALQLYDSLLHALGERSPELRARLLGQMGYAYLEKGEPRTAIELCQRSITLAESIGDERAKAEATTDLAYALWQVNERERALGVLERAFAYNQRTGNTDRQRDLAWELHEWNEELGRRDASHRMLKTYAQLTDSVARSRYDAQLARSEIRFDTERKERRISEQEQALLLSDAQEQRKSLQRDLLLIVAIALVVVIVLLWRGLAARKRMAEQERELHRQRVDELMRRNEIDALNAMMEGQEKERERLAKDLHDRLGSMLSAVKHQLGALEGEVQAVRRDQSEHYAKLSRMLDEAVGEVRRISHDMVTITLARFGLQKALEDLCDSVRIHGRLEVELNLFGLERRTDRALEIAIHRMVQELVSNVLKHAGASELSVSVMRQPGRFSVIVADDGRGFDTSMAADGIGLDNVRTRAAAIGATVHIDSAPGKGTTVSEEGAVAE